MMSTFSPIHFPTTTVFVDDELSFLEQLTAAVDAGEHLKICQDFREITDFVRKSPQIFSLRDINKLMADQKKHEFISTIVVDYQMKPDDGLEICKSLIDSPTVKIMLTGIASKDKAIEAHNDGIIDYFISKKDSEFLIKLNNALTLGKHKYFERISKRIKGYFNADNPLIDPHCAAFLKNELNDAQDYYVWFDFNRLSSNTPEKGRVDYMMTSEEQYAALLDCHEANNASEEAIRRLQDRGAMLWYHEAIPPGEEWIHYLAKSAKISGSNYYISKGRFWN